MNSKLKYSIAVIIVIAFYAYAIIEKALGLVSYTVNTILINNFLLICLVLGLIYFLNKYLLQNTLLVFVQRKENFIIYLIIGLLLVSIIYVINSLGVVTYRNWIHSDYDNSVVENTLKEILSNKIYAFFLLGPIVWLSEVFGVISRVFLLNNLWELQKSKLWCWISIIFIALLFSLLQIDKGFPDMINSFLIVLASNIFYLKFRNVVPLIIAPILYTTIDLIAFWVYNF